METQTEIVETLCQYLYDHNKKWYQKFKTRAMILGWLLDNDLILVRRNRKIENEVKK